MGKTGSGEFSCQKDEPAIASYGVLQVFEELAGKRKDFTAAHVKSVESLLKLQVGRRINLPYDLAALRTYGGILLGERQLLGMSDRNLSPKEYDPVKAEKNQERNALQKSVQLSKKELETACEQVLFTDNVFYLKIFSNEGQKIEEKKYTKWMDYDKIEKNPYIRTRRTGDYMVINAQGNTKKLNRCMIDEKIPSEYRDSIPLIACGKEILWMVGSRMNERYKINPQTRKVLVLNYQGGNENE